MFCNRPSHYRTALRDVPFYVSMMVYELKSFCCRGYLGNAEDPAGCIGMYTYANSNVCLYIHV